MALVNQGLERSPGAIPTSPMVDSSAAPATSLPVLERLFHRECRSLTQYFGESWPWSRDNEGAAQDLIQSVLADERRWAEQLAQLIVERGGQPRMGSYPVEFSSSNLHYVALKYALQRLADYLERSITWLRADLAEVEHDSAIRAIIDQMIERKTGQVEALRKFENSSI